MKQLTTREFNKLPKYKRVIIVIKDVMKQLQSSVYKTGRAGYDTKFIKPKFRNKFEYKDDAATILREHTAEIQCIGCARASLFISLVKFKNELTVEQVEYSGGFNYSGYETGTEKTEYLFTEFSEMQQSLIESAYERTGYGDYSKLREKAVEFGKMVSRKYNKEKHSMSRSNYILLQICKNIIKNEGKFKP